MFTGNIGESQDFKSIIKAVLILKMKNKWILVIHRKEYKKY